MQWGPIWMVTNLCNPPLFFLQLVYALPHQWTLSLLSLSFLFFLSPFTPFLPSATAAAAAAHVPMNCGKVRVQGLQRIILIYAGAGPVAKRVCRPPPGPAGAVRLFYGSPAAGLRQLRARLEKWVAAAPAVFHPLRVEGV